MFEASLNDFISKDPKPLSSRNMTFEVKSYVSLEVKYSTFGTLGFTL